MRRPTLTPVAAIVLAAALALAGYGGTYVARSKVSEQEGCVKLRTYRTESESIAFVPAAFAERVVTGKFVCTMGPRTKMRPATPWPLSLP